MRLFYVERLFFNHTWLKVFFFYQFITKNWKDILYIGSWINLRAYQLWSNLYHIFISLWAHLILSNYFIIRIKFWFKSKPAKTSFWMAKSNIHYLTITVKILETRVRQLNNTICKYYIYQLYKLQYIHICCIHRVHIYCMHSVCITYRHYMYTLL